jgi:hypothetical protein
MNEKYFPAVMTKKTAGAFEAILGLEMKSLLKGSLFFDKNQTEDIEEKGVSANQYKMTILREGLIQAISAWPETITLELRVTSLPNIQFSAQGRLLITMTLHAINKSEIKAKQEALAKYLVLRGLLQSHMPEAEFAPISHRDELKFHLSPFKMTHGVAVHRRAQKIQITEALVRKTVTGLFPENNVPEATQRGHFVNYVYPWRPSQDDWSRLIQTMMGQFDPIQLIVRLRPAQLSSAQRKAMENDIQTCEIFIHSGRPYQISLERQAALLRNVLLNQLTELSHGALNVGVFFYAGHPIDPSLGNILGQAITARTTMSENDSIFSGGFTVSKMDIKKAFSSNYFPEKAPYTIREAACAFRLPSPPMQDVPGLSIRRSRTALSLLPDLAPGKEDGIDLCRNIHNGMSQPVRLPADDRMRHTFLIGQTGTGKSTLMESMILQDILAGHGLAVIDPHGDMVDSVLGKIPPERIDDVILFDFLDRERPLGFNLLQWQTEEERDFVIDEIYDTLDKIYDMKTTGGPIFETNMRGMLRLLMGGNPVADDYKPTILEFRDCYLHVGFRKWLVKRINDSITTDFIKELEKTGGDAHINNIAPYITSKFGRFVHDTTLMNIIGQESTSFNFDEIMAQGKIFLVKLGKGRFGSSVSALLANQLVSRFKHAAMKRGEMRSEDRREFYLYVDECHNLPASNFTELLSEARKYRMGLVLATQYATQLYSNKPGENLLSAILGNVGCMTIFRLGQEDARLLSQSLYPYFNTMDIIGLPNWQGYCRLQIKNAAVTPFSFESVMDKTPYDLKIAKKVRDISRLKYGCDSEIIKTKIEMRRNIWKAVDQ